MTVGPTLEAVAGAETAPARRRGPTPNRRPRRRSWRDRERNLASGSAVVALLPFIIFAIVPVGFVVFLSFTRYNGVVDPVWIGLENYVDLATDGAWWASVRNTLIFGIASVVVEVPIALGLALLLNRGLRFLGTFRTIFFIPHVVSIAVMGIVFYFLLRPVGGVINGLIGWLPFIGAEFDWLGHQHTAMASLVAVGVWSSFGINTVFFLVGLQTVPREVMESASIDGASGWQRFRHITLPLIAPMTRIIVMLTIVFTMRSFDIVKTLTDGGPAGGTEVMFTYLFSYFFSLDRGTQYGYGSALAVVASLIIAVVSLIYLQLSRSGERGVER